MCVKVVPKTTALKKCILGTYLKTMNILMGNDCKLFKSKLIFDQIELYLRFFYWEPPASFYRTHSFETISVKYNFAFKEKLARITSVFLILCLSSKICWFRFNFRTKRSYKKYLGFMICFLTKFVKLQKNCLNLHRGRKKCQTYFMESVL